MQSKDKINSSIEMLNKIGYLLKETVKITQELRQKDPEKTELIYPDLLKDFHKYLTYIGPKLKDIKDEDLWEICKVLVWNLASVIDRLCTLNLNIIEIYYPGPTHTYDNLVVYIPSKKILFGGCMVLSSDTEKVGYIKDGNIEEWIGPYSSGDIVKLSHSWKLKGNYWIKAWAKDVIGDESQQASFKFIVLTNANKEKTKHLISYNILLHLVEHFLMMNRYFKI